ncbi:hypothetical protein BP5796_06294 [Coleophoma crateriformis]|uniref:Uncharacterized protein n=1 Tax=Coleophoma crateriformis TaxID=565419 RepID=A0A3D8RWI1_9HELO|nr:hypothetical protein BP5796_06294 [Coleophoma crateriformis]
MAETKAQFVSGFEEFDTHVEQHKPKTGSPRAVEAARLGLTVLAFVAGVVIVGTSADTLSTFDSTSLAADFYLPLWPVNLDTRPTVALIICGAIIVVASAASLATSKVPSLRSKTTLHHLSSISTPVISLIAAVIAVSFSYGINNSSSDFSIQGWSCQWSAINMTIDPHFETLCMESKTALYLSVMIMPLEVLVLGAVVVDFVTAKRHAVTFAVQERKGSPAMS